MNIKVSDLRRFKKYADKITGANILPIAGYLKFGDKKIVKTAFSSFVQFDCEDAIEPILVEERLLNGLLDQTPSDFINISKKGNKVTLSDGRDKFVFQVPDIKEFPAIASPQDEKTPLSSEFMEAIGMAGNFSLPMGDIPEKYMYVHVGGKAVCAGDGIVGFHCPITEPLVMVIEKKISQMLGKYSVSSFSESENYYFFTTNDAVLGFGKQSIGWMDIRHVFKATGNRTFSASSGDIQSFNSLSMKASAACIVTMSKGLFEMSDPLYDIKHERPAENLELPEPFTYNPGKMNTLLSALGCEELDFYDINGGYFIKSADTKATAIIAKISK